MKRAVWLFFLRWQMAVQLSFVQTGKPWKKKKKKKPFPQEKSIVLNVLLTLLHTLQYMHLSLYTPSCPQLDSWAHRSCNGLVHSVIAACDFIIGGSAALGGGNSRRKQSICSALF